MRPPLPPIRLAFDSVDTMRAEFQRNLRAGGAFCPGVSGFTERTACMLVLVHPVSKDVLELNAEVVFVKPEDPGKGVGLHLADFGPAIQEKLQAFMQVGLSAPPPAHDSACDPQPQPQPQPQTSDDPAEGSPAHKLAVSALHDRLRGMSLAAQIKLAREGGMTERVALERLLGKSVWEALLQNQRVTPPEVSRIARMGTASVGIIDTISSNAAWLQSSEVRRALLSNPRLSEDGVTRVLRHMSKPELRLMCNQAIYPPRIRKLAKTLCGIG